MPAVPTDNRYRVAARSAARDDVLLAPRTRTATPQLPAPPATLLPADVVFATQSLATPAVLAHQAFQSATKTPASAILVLRPQIVPARQSVQTAMLAPVLVSVARVAPIVLIHLPVRSAAQPMAHVSLATATMLVSTHQTVRTVSLAPVFAANVPAMLTAPETSRALHAQLAGVALPAPATNSVLLWLPLPFRPAMLAMAFAGLVPRTLNALVTLPAQTAVKPVIRPGASPVSVIKTAVRKALDNVTTTQRDLTAPRTLLVLLNAVQLPPVQLPRQRHRQLEPQLQPPPAHQSPYQRVKQLQVLPQYRRTRRPPRPCPLNHQQFQQPPQALQPVLRVALQ